MFYQSFVVVLAVLGIRGLPIDEQSLAPGMNNTSIAVNPHRYPVQIVVVNGANCASGIHSPAVKKRDDYQHTPGIGYHKFHTRALKWNSVRKSCEVEGGHLAIINSRAEREVLLRMWSNAPKITGSEYQVLAWLGFHDLYEEGDWITIHGEWLASTGFEEWDNDEPSKSSLGQNCGVLHVNSRIHDGDCNLPMAYFCELPESPRLR